MIRYILFCCCLLPISLFCQSLSGTVLDDKGETLIGASIYWEDNSNGTTTDANGQFSIILTAMNKKLIASYVGYQSDTLIIKTANKVQFTLTEAATLDEVVITDRKDGIAISNITPIKVENITSGELKKAACCDLAGCFETQVSVETQVTNVITNAKELRIAGLSGVYNQVLIDGFPMIQGLTYTYGLTSVPGTLVKNIYVAKGANSVLQGYESISGQINVITKDPELDELFFFNAYVNSFGEKQFNANTSFKVGNWENILAVHTVLPAKEQDKDQDNFLDVPKLQRYLISDKWKLGKEGEWGWNSEINLRYLHEKRIGGQRDYDSNLHKGSTAIYGQTVNLSQPEISSKTGFRFNDKHNFSFFASSFYQDQDAWFGTVQYNANQTNVYSNFQYEYNYGKDGINSLKTGISYRHLNLKETIAFSENSLNRTYEGNYQRKEHIPGFFAEHSMQLFNSKMTWMIGLRGDNHNDFGFFLTPRTLLKYELGPQTVIRANMGTGWRTVNLFSENINLLVSSRDIIFEESLEAEEAANAGINLTHKIEGVNVNGYISADFYHTNFKNQIFPDYDSDPTKAIIKNYKGTSISNSFQLEGGMRIYKTVELKLGYNYLDVYRQQNEEKQSLPFNAQHKILTVFGYRPLSNKFQFDANVHWYGKRRLPSTSANPELYQRPDYSDPYTTVNAQFTYNFKQLEIYGGCENIFDFRQERPIISWENPFSPYFDTSSVWGPTRGREFYLGVRYRIVK